MRIFCDTNILVRVALSPSGLANELLERIAAGHQLVTSSAQLSELFEVLRRPAIAALHKLDERGIRRFIARVYKLSVVVPLPADVPLILPHDPKDDPIVMTAVVGRAQVLCTLDRHLRSVAVAAFCRPHGIEILTDQELLQRLRGTSPKP
jgi:predicted nucleic acid-binding protein